MFSEATEASNTVKAWKGTQSALCTHRQSLQVLASSLRDTPTDLRRAEHRFSDTSTSNLCTLTQQKES